MVGDLPFANVRPPENVLFVCKLNPVTRDEDLELIFSRFGVIMSCQVIRDKKTGDSLQYAFIEFDKREDAEQASFIGLVPPICTVPYLTFVSRYRLISRCKTSLWMIDAYGLTCTFSFFYLRSVLAIYNLTFRAAHNR